MVDLGLKGSPAIKNRKEALKILSRADILSIEFPDRLQRDSKGKTTVHSLVLRRRKYGV